MADFAARIKRCCPSKYALCAHFRLRTRPFVTSPSHSGGRRFESAEPISFVFVRVGSFV
jgi:hypothetical protein